MEFLGIGPLELLIVLLLALVLLGPKDMAKAGKSMGKFMRKVVTSPQWRVITQTSHELRNLPNRLIREAGLDEMQQEINVLQQTTAEIQDSLRVPSILPPNWQGETPAQSPVGSTVNTTGGNDPESTSGEVNTQVPEPARDVQKDTHSQTPNGLSAWTGSPQTTPEQTPNPQVDFSAWITPPQPPKKSSVKKQR